MASRLARLPRGGAIAAVVLLLAALLAPAPAAAHRLKVFATAVAADIEGSVYFVGGGPAANVPVRIEAPPGTPAATLITNADGRFTLTARVRAEHLLIADAGDGHAARFTIAAAALPATLPAATPPAASDRATDPPTDPPPAPLAAAATATTAGAAAAGAEAGAAAQPIRDAVAEAVASQLAPLRADFDAYRAEIRLRDILGGIGWILGLAGVALWAGRRRHRPSG